jgi:hypothetical protein
MPKTTNDPETVSAEAPAAGDFPLSLDEFCQRLSTTDKRVELIGAFYHVEKAAKRGNDTSGNFTARFQAFVNQPA